MEYRKQKLELNWVDSKKKVFNIFTKKERLLEKDYPDDFVVYSVSEDIKKGLYRFLPKSENLMVI